LAVTAVVMVLSAIGIAKVKHNNNVYENTREKDEISSIMNFMEHDMYGIRELTLMVSLKDEGQSLFDQNSLQQLDKIEKFVEQNYDATVEVGLATSAKLVNRAINNGNVNAFIIPEEQDKANEIRAQLIKNADKINLKSFVAAKTNSTYIKAKTKDLGSYVNRRKNVKLLAFAKQNSPDLTINFGGNSYIVDETNVNVSEGMIWNLGMIILFIFVIISFNFKSMSIGFFSLFPNILPLIVITAVVGWFNLGMNIATTIVYTIAFGIAVDDTIHFLGRYKIEIDKGVENTLAIQNSMRTSGGAIFLTTLIFVAGFGVLTTSAFYANFMTGLLISIGMIMALLCDLYLLPVILHWLRKGK
jgi:predicted RND superfamily exporter protein